MRFRVVLKLIYNGIGLIPLFQNRRYAILYKPAGRFEPGDFRIDCWRAKVGGV